MISDDDLGFFARNGFLTIKHAIPDEVCSALVQHTWTRLPSHWSPSQPEGWHGMVPDSCHTADVRVRRGHLQFQKGDLIGDPIIAENAGLGSHAARLAESVIGAPLFKMRTRGLYCIVPLPAAIQFKALAKPHIESHPTQLVFLFYLEDVDWGGGGLYVWPGSHREIYPVMGSKLEHVTTNEYDNVFQKWAHLQPIEVPGKRGDAVVIHHRLLHSPSLNRSQKMRYAFLCDYQREDFRKLSAELPTDDVWEDWPAIQQLPETVKAAACDFDLSTQVGLIDDVPLHSARYRLSEAHSKDTDTSNIRKGDASALARARKVGDIWIAISDQPETLDDWQLHPKGSDLTVSGLRVKCNGDEITSLCKYDFIARLPLRSGVNAISIEGNSVNVYVRIIRINLPFDSSDFLIRREISYDKCDINIII